MRAVVYLALVVFVGLLAIASGQFIGDAIANSLNGTTELIEGRAN